MILADLVRELERWEGRYGWLYLDVRGFPTIGVGQLVATADAAAKLPLAEQRPDGSFRPAPEAAKRAAWAKVHAAPPARRASFYRPLTSVRLRDPDIEAIAQTRIALEFLPGLRRLYPAFDSLPLGPRAALLDLAYNLGVAGLGRYVRLRAAVNAGDWTAAAAESAVPSSRKERNDWRRARLLEGA